MKHEFTIVDTSRQRILSTRKGYVELLPEYFKLLLDFRCEEFTSDDDNLPGVEKEYFNNRIIDRYSIGEICLYKVVTSNNWCVEVSTSSGVETAGIQFKNGEYEKAKRLFNEILEWRYPKSKTEQ